MQVLARAFDRGHHYELCDAGADYVISETYDSALNLGAESLVRLGVHPFKAEQIKQGFIPILFLNYGLRSYFDRLVQR
ncbi:hypothetical protein [uncultured Endozoicomonas sp.]|uniref:hypothetical protein n=1 Tax=uncultured Endozoicomonas sp. TaxID=432652 RepID=UPI00260F838D|nr:hypothetical protein [uncultured Endozoicomonas sp.]